VGNTVLEILAMDGHRVDQVRVTTEPESEEGAG
jgi:CBS domain containing-hemolysin-like protein